MAYTTRFTPRHPEKYAGNPRNIICRSLWERKFAKYCDDTPGIVRWASEELIIPYISPVDGRPHRYYPDFLVEIKAINGKTKCILIEVKPKKQTLPPTLPKRKTRKYIAEMATFAVNGAKWSAAREFCRQKGWEFLILTEDELFAKVK